MCAPEFFHLRHGEYSYPKNVYANDGQYWPVLGLAQSSYDLTGTQICRLRFTDEYFADITIAYREEIQELYSLGCRKSSLFQHYMIYREI